MVLKPIVFRVTRFIAIAVNHVGNKAQQASHLAQGLLVAIHSTGITINDVKVIYNIGDITQLHGVYHLRPTQIRHPMAVQRLKHTQFHTHYGRAYHHIVKLKQPSFEIVTHSLELYHLTREKHTRHFFRKLEMLKIYINIYTSVQYEHKRYHRRFHRLIPEIIGIISVYLEMLVTLYL